MRDTGEKKPPRRAASFGARLGPQRMGAKKPAEAGWVAGWSVSSVEVNLFRVTKAWVDGVHVALEVIWRFRQLHDCHD